MHQQSDDNEEYTIASAMQRIDDYATAIAMGAEAGDGADIFRVVGDILVHQQMFARSITQLSKVLDGLIADLVDAGVLTPPND